MLELEQVHEQLQSLGLGQAATALDRWLDVGAKEDMATLAVIRHLLEEEMAARHERYLKARTWLVPLPFHKTLADFDFDAKPNINERQVREPYRPKRVSKGLTGRALRYAYLLAWPAFG